MRIKICGITSQRDVQLLATLPIHLAGLWYGNGDGHANLSADQVCKLADGIRDIAHLSAVLVTLTDDLPTLREVISASEFSWVQLHGFQSPSLAAELKRSFAGLRIIKALHLVGQHCIEGPIMKAYERAGVDMFLFDSATLEGQLGSTGQCIDSTAAFQLAETATRPFLIAGGISAETLGHHRALLSYRRFAGIDADTAARGPQRQLCAARIGAIVRSLSTHIASNDGHEISVS